MKISLDRALLFYTPLHFDSRDSRAAAENAAVDALVAEAFGPGAVKANYADGAPYVILPDGTNVDISLSHCHTCAVLARALDAGCRIGVDAETQRPQLQRVAPRVLSALEMQHYAPMTDGLLAAWTLKEALYKAARVVGADFKADIALPVPPGSSTAQACGYPCRVIFSAPLCDAFVSLVLC